MLGTARFCRKVTPVLSLNYLRAFLHAVQLCRSEGFLPAEAFRLGLFHPDMHGDRPGRYVSRKRLTKLQEALNPSYWAPLVRNKGIFYQRCTGLGVPVPRLYAVFFSRAPGWSCDGSILASRLDWGAFLRNHVPDEFVVKPTQGAYGRGVNILRRNRQGFLDAFGNTYTSDSLYASLSAASGQDGLVIQERLRNHPELVRLSGTESLQTVRIITLLHAEGTADILHAHLKIIVGKHIVDTYLEGLMGNVEAAVNLDTGSLKAANQITDTGRGIMTIPEHPETGVRFEGFRLPLWSETCGLARLAATKFAPLRAIGWDIAITPNGPCVTEGNAWWDPPNQHDCIPGLLRALKAGIAAAQSC